MIPCTCKDWETTAETLMDFCSIGEMYFCPWCGKSLEDEVDSKKKKTIDLNAGIEESTLQAYKDSRKKDPEDDEPTAA